MCFFLLPLTCNIFLSQLKHADKTCHSILCKFEVLCSVSGKVFYMNADYIRRWFLSSSLSPCHSPLGSTKLSTAGCGGVTAKTFPQEEWRLSLQVDAGVELLKWYRNSRVCWMLRGVRHMRIHLKLQMRKVMISKATSAFSNLWKTVQFFKGTLDVHQILWPPF